MIAKLRGLILLAGFLLLTCLFPIQVWADCNEVDEIMSHPENPYPDSECPLPPSEDADWCSADVFKITKEVKIPRDQQYITPDDRHIQCEAGITALYTELPLLDVTRDDVRPCLDTGTLKWEYILPWLVGEQRREPIADAQSECGYLIDPTQRNQCLGEIFKEQEARAGVLQKLTPADEQDKLKISMIARLANFSSLDEQVHNYVVCYYNASGPVTEEERLLTGVHELRLTDYYGHFPPENNCTQFRNDRPTYFNCLEDYYRRLDSWKNTIYGQCWSAVPMVSKDALKVPLILAVPNEGGPNAQSGSLWGDGDSGKSFSLGRADLYLPHVQGTIEATSYLQKLLAPTLSRALSDTDSDPLIASPADYSENSSNILGVALCRDPYSDNPLGVNDCDQQIAVWNPGDYIYGPPGEDENNPWRPERGNIVETNWTVDEDGGICANPHYDSQYLVSSTEADCDSNECRSYDHHVTIDVTGTQCRCWNTVPKDTFLFSTQGMPWMVPGQTFTHLADVFALGNFAFLRSLSLYSGDIYPEPGSGREIVKMPGKGTLDYICNDTYASGKERGFGYLYYEWLGTLQTMRQQLIKNRYPAEFDNIPTTLENNIAGWTGFGDCNVASLYSGMPAPGAAGTPTVPGTPGEYPVPPIPEDDPICGGDRYCNPFCYEDYYKEYYVNVCFDTVDFCSQQYTYLIFSQEGENLEDYQSYQQKCCHTENDIQAYFLTGDCGAPSSPSTTGCSERNNLVSCRIQSTDSYRVVSSCDEVCSGDFPIKCWHPDLNQVVCAGVLPPPETPISPTIGCFERNNLGSCSTEWIESRDNYMIAPNCSYTCDGDFPIKCWHPDLDQVVCTNFPP